MKLVAGWRCWRDSNNSQAEMTCQQYPVTEVSLDPPVMTTHFTCRASHSRSARWKILGWFPQVGFGHQTSAKGFNTIRESFEYHLNTYCTTTFTTSSMKIQTWGFCLRDAHKFQELGNALQRAGAGQCLDGYNRTTSVWTASVACCNS